MSAALATTKDAGIKALIEQAAPKIRQVLSRHIDSERFVRLCIYNITRNPQLAKCTPLSLLECVMTAAELGVNLGGALGESYAIPYGQEAKFILGYKGMAKLVREADDNIETIEAHVVRKGDVFEWELGLTPKLRHVPQSDVGSEVIGAWALVRFKSGGFQRDYMSKAELDRIQKRSRAGSSGPWVTDAEEMQKKTVFRRLAKWLSLSPRAAEALEREFNDLGDDVADTVVTEVKEPVSRTKRIASKLAEPTPEPPEQLTPEQIDEMPPLTEDGAPPLSMAEQIVLTFAEKHDITNEKAQARLDSYCTNLFKKNLAMVKDPKTLENVMSNVRNGQIVP